MFVSPGIVYCVCFSRYHQDTDHWEYVASMNEARQSPGVAVLNRLIYVLGGFDGRKRLNSVECYHPERNQWELVSPLQRARSGAGGLCCTDGSHVAFTPLASILRSFDRKIHRQMDNRECNPCTCIEVLFEVQ